MNSAPMLDHKKKQKQAAERWTTAEYWGDRRQVAHEIHEKWQKLKHNEKGSNKAVSKRNGN